MNKFLEKLLNGRKVEWRSLKEIAEYRRGSFPQPYGEAKWYGGKGSMPFVQVYDVNENMNLNEKTKKTISKLAQPKSVYVPKGTVIVSLQGSIGRVAITQYDSYVDRTLAIFTKYKIDINKKYFAYQLKRIFDIKKQKARGSTLKTITKEEFSKFKIPIPPLDVQREIVRVLDNFTELTAELTAELSLRKKQYEYYRDKLLTFGDEVEWKELGDKEYFEVSSGGTPSKTKVEYWENGTIPWIKSESCNNKAINNANHYITKLGLEKSSAKLLKKETTLIALVGATKFKTGFLEFEAATNQNIASIKSKKPNVINDKFIFYYLTSLYKKLKSEMNNYGMLNLSTLRQFKIPIPHIEKQKEIVEILDKFDTLTNSITEGLPKEISLRHKQYEYYRDMLLDFKERE